MSLDAHQKLQATSVAIAGLRSTGHIASMFLASAGVGKIGLIEEAKVTEADLHRQILLSSQNLGNLQVEACQLNIQQHSLETQIVCHPVSLDAHNAEDIFQNYDLILDGLISWQDKLLASDVCMSLYKPLIHTGITGFNFQLFTMRPGKSACLRCLFSKLGLEDFPQENTLLNVSAPMLGMLGSFQAQEAIKLLSGIGITQADECLSFDGLRRELHALRGFFPSADCPDCIHRN